MKKLAYALLLIVIIGVIPLTLISCSKDISFKEEQLTNNLDREFKDYYMQTVIGVKSMEDLKKFTDLPQFKNTIVTGLAKFDESYFKDYSLIIVCILDNFEPSTEVTKITKKQKEIFVHFEHLPYNKPNFYTYKFLTVEKDLLDDVNKYSYVSITI